jgi:hypothetical protein
MTKNVTILLAILAVIVTVISIVSRRKNKDINPY